MNELKKAIKFICTLNCLRKLSEYLTRQWSSFFLQNKSCRFEILRFEELKIKKTWSRDGVKRFRVTHLIMFIKNYYGILTVLTTSYPLLYATYNTHLFSIPVQLVEILTVYLTGRIPLEAMKGERFAHPSTLIYPRWKAEMLHLELWKDALRLTISTEVRNCRWIHLS